MDFLETIYYYFQMLIDYLLGKESDEYQEYNENEHTTNNPMQTQPHFETHQVYPCKETF
jgi:hypothetical protein